MNFMDFIDKFFVVNVHLKTLNLNKMERFIIFSPDNTEKVIQNIVKHKIRALDDSNC